MIRPSKTVIRTSIAALAFSAAGFAGLVDDEGYTDHAVIPVKADRPTIGFGSTFREDGSPVQMGDTITPQKAISRSLAHIQKDEAGIKSCITAPLSQVEYDTAVSFAYQYGAGAFCSSSIARYANAQDYVQSCRGYLDFRYMTSPSQIPGWEPYKFDAIGRPIRWRFDCSTPGNKVCRGVWTRSQERYQTCMAAQ